MSKRRDDAGRPGFFSKLLGKNKTQAGVNDEAFERSTSLLGICAIADNPLEKLHLSTLTNTDDIPYFA